MSFVGANEPYNDICLWSAYGEELQDETTSNGGDAQYTVHDPVGFEGQYGYYSDFELAQRYTDPTYHSYLDTTLQPTLCGSRYYDPSTGRFASRDPIDYAGGLNLYGYCGDDPVNAVKMFRHLH